MIVTASNASGEVLLQSSYFFMGGSTVIEGG